MSLENSDHTQQPERTNPMKPQFGKYDFFLVVTNRSSGGPKHLVADVYANRKATNNPDYGWFSFSRSNKIGRVSLYPWDKGWLANLKGADGKRYKAIFANEPGIDTIREALADIVNGSAPLAELALAPESE
nr:MAG TPA: hypothetical protein [Caudoviricetes sp.]